MTDKKGLIYVSMIAIIAILIMFIITTNKYDSTYNQKNIISEEECYDILLVHNKPNSVSEKIHTIGNICVNEAGNTKITDTGIVEMKLY